MAAVAAILLVAGGLDAIQQAQILIAVPFGVVMVLIAWALHRALRADHREERRQEEGEEPDPDARTDEQQAEEILRFHDSGETAGRRQIGQGE